MHSYPHRASSAILSGPLDKQRYNILSIGQFIFSSLFSLKYFASETLSQRPQVLQGKVAHVMHPDGPLQVKFCFLGD